VFKISQSRRMSARKSGFLLEGLESRRLLSVSPVLLHAETQTTGSTISQSQAGAGTDQSVQIVLFSAAPTAVQTGLQTLAGSTTIKSDQPVHENALPDGTEIYCIRLVSSGTATFYAVDSTGAAIPVPQPPQQGGSSGTTGTSGGTGGTSNGSTVVLFSAAPTAVQTGLQTLAGSTTIPSDQPVHENALPDGTEIYCIRLVVSGTATFYAVDSTGAAVPVPQPPQQGGSAGSTGSTGSTGSSGSTGTTGSASAATVVLFSAAPTAVQTGLQTLAGSTTIPSDQPVHENALPDGTEIYCIRLVVSGTATFYAVDATGTAVPVPQPPPPPQSGSTTGSDSGTGTGTQQLPPPPRPGGPPDGSGGESNG
jgi:hypothetical protein